MFLRSYVAGVCSVHEESIHGTQAVSHDTFFEVENWALFTEGKKKTELYAAQNVSSFIPKKG